MWSVAWFITPILMAYLPLDRSLVPTGGHGQGVYSDGSDTANDSASASKTALIPSLATEAPSGGVRATVFVLSALVAAAFIAILVVNPTWLEGGMLDDKGEYYEYTPPPPVVQPPVTPTPTPTEVDQGESGSGTGEREDGTDEPGTDAVETGAGAPEPEPEPATTPPEPKAPKPKAPKPKAPKPKAPKPKDPKPKDPKPEDPKPEDPKPEDPKPEDPKPKDEPLPVEAPDLDRLFDPLGQ